MCSKIYVHFTQTDALAGISKGTSVTVLSIQRLCHVRNTTITDKPRKKAATNL